LGGQRSHGAGIAKRGVGVYETRECKIGGTNRTSEAFIGDHHEHKGGRTPRVNHDS